MATSSSHVDNYDASKFWIASARNFRTSARLHLQHFLFQNTIGYLLEPIIEESLVASSRPLKVADLACGNGIWLTELHSHFAKNNISAQRDGFDINPVNFPDAAYLPDSVSIKQLDILSKPLPADLIGIYDVVHIRAFVSVIPDGDLTPILSVASELLKPGGFLRWEETRGDKWAQGINNEWVDVLDTRLGQFGFQDARLLSQEKRKQDYKGWTEDYLMVWEECAAFFLPKSQALDAPLTREVWTEMFANSVKETEQGVAVHQGKVVTVVGRRPQ
ncbi:conserved hypothetical protein [Talaromyces stipitatus ATCC 10500]|uniref:Uncharacterized protein n=1 Tax=Talaromyces stipitatus (strain ATCC 10500 / CBS 375.48 / QM 6759 / NRRL 1006) TaxID=441959 RepID=B8MM23_TALSN|nr:uncharacterized protein TSTA_097910 [Talaromyces stipitatus ATCC 10500]EED13535.1 conserved hypothetical protein [Talaromyces stipitatus ATCC 10500]